MEFEWGYAIISLVLWLIFTAFWWGIIPSFGEKSYIEVFGLPSIIILTVILLPVSYVIVYMIAER